MKAEKKRSIYQNLSPLDHRYYLANTELFEQLGRYLSEDAAIRYQVKVEGALLRAHMRERGLDSKELLERLSAAEDTVEAKAVYEEEEKTQHQIRALVRVFASRLPEKLKPYLHLGATSVDIIDTAAALRIRDAVRAVLLPLLLNLVDTLLDTAEAEAETPQVGRTHGQHAVPITFGFALAEYVARLGKSTEKIWELSGDLRGKLSGAVGGYNAMSLITEDPIELERTFLGELGLAPAEYANQVVEPEYLLRLLLELNTAFGILANLADDLRNLQRSELGEVQELFDPKQVGSSTMPQKRNPWNSEHVKSLWKTFFPRVITFFMDQISEHQRDLTNSASGRFIADYIGGLVAAANRMLRVVRTLRVDREALRRNLQETGDFLLAEAAYVLLAQEGVEDAHETLRRCTLKSEESGRNLKEVLEEDPRLWEKIEHRLSLTLGVSAEDFFSDPASYRGKTVERTRKITTDYRKRIAKLQALCRDSFDG
jgi:adenylosuccinate lyase